MAGARRTLVRAAPYILGAVGLVILLLAARSFIGSSGFAYDFEAYDSAARRIAAGEPLYPPGTAEAYNSGAYAGLYLYAPPLAVALVPLAALPATSAALAWFWVRLAVLVAGVAILPIPRLARGALLAVGCVSFPVLYDLNLGNLSVILFAISALIWRYRGHPVASVALAVAGTVRYPFAIVLFAWLVERSWRAVAWTVAAGLVIAAATLPVVGFGGWSDYVGTLTGLGSLSSGEHNLSLATTAGAVGLPGPSGLWVGLGIAVALAASLYAAWRRDAETALVVSLTATILFAPFFHPHYLVQLLIPAAFLVGRGQWWGIALPLLGWLPGEVLALVAIGGILAPLTPARIGAVRAGSVGAGAAFEAGPTRP